MSLSHDILWSIFMLNAMNSAVRIEERLATTRVTSHVCRPWRQLILGSASIWAKLIFINNWQKGEWMQEVLKRAGLSSLLWVHIDWLAHNDTTPLPLIFIFICTRFWNRVEVLDISVYLQDRSIPLFWKLMENPAPKLRFVAITISDVRFSSKIRTGPTQSLPTNLFSNDAPLLTSISCSTFSINHKPTWLSQIEILEMSVQSIDVFLDIITWTTRLRILRISRIDNLNRISDAQCSRIASMSSYILSRLAKIDTGPIDIKAFNALWCTKYKSPAKSTTTHYINWTWTLDDMEGSQFQKAFDNMLYHHNGLTSSVDDVSWNLSINDWELHIYISSNSLQLMLNFRCPNMASNTWDVILQHFKPYTVYVRNFNLSMTNSDTALEELFDILTSMCNVLTISVCQAILKWYNRVQDSKGLLFPMLKKINYENDPEKDGYLSNLVEFLQRRQDAGWFLPTIHIKKYTDMSYVCDVLNHFIGLRITWNFDEEKEDTQDREYICGEAEPLEWNEDWFNPEPSDVSD